MNLNDSLLKGSCSRVPLAVFHGQRVLQVRGNSLPTLDTVTMWKTFLNVYSILISNTTACSCFAFTQTLKVVVPHSSTSANDTNAISLAILEVPLAAWQSYLQRWLVKSLVAGHPICISTKNLCVSGWDKCQDLCQRPTLAAMPLSANTLLPTAASIHDTKPGLPDSCQNFTIRNHFLGGLWLLHKVSKLLRFGVQVSIPYRNSGADVLSWLQLQLVLAICVSGYKARCGPSLRLPGYLSVLINNNYTKGATSKISKIMEESLILWDCCVYKSFGSLHAVHFFHNTRHQNLRCKENSVLTSFDIWVQLVLCLRWSFCCAHEDTWTATTRNWMQKARDSLQVANSHL